MARRIFKLSLAAILILVLVSAAYLLVRPLPAIQPQLKIPANVEPQSVALPWPAYGQGALGAAGYGVLATSHEQTPLPIGSIAKVITALAVLKQKPLALNQQGPLITIDAADFASYNYYYTHDGSVARVAVGEQISEYQALQAMLLPSANNMADTLARWAFGSVDNYAAYANQMVKQLGLAQTTVSGASGFTNETVSSAEDLVNLGIAALSNPVIAQIVNQQQAVVPVAGTVNNVNWLLGEDGVIGIKTGNTDLAGGCYLFAAKRTVSGENVTVVGALLAAPSLNASIADARAVLKTVDAGFQKVTPVKKGQILAAYTSPWGGRAFGVAQKDLDLLIWKSQGARLQTSLHEVKARTKANSPVGAVNVISGSRSVDTLIVLQGPLAAPSLSWRFTHW